MYQEKKKSQDFFVLPIQLLQAAAVPWQSLWCELVLWAQ